MAVVSTVDYKKAFRSMFQNSAYAFKDANKVGFIEAGKALFTTDSFRITEGIPLNILEDNIPFQEAALAIEFVTSESGDMDGQFHGIGTEQFVGNHMIHTVVIQFLSNPEMTWEYNGKLYKIPTIKEPAQDYDLKELVFWWIMKILTDNKEYTSTDIDWVILFDGPNGGWRYENYAEFSGFSLEIYVAMQIKTNPYGGS